MDETVHYIFLLFNG